MSVVDLSWGVGSGLFSLAGGMLFAVMWMFTFTIIIGIAFLLVRFLLVATSAAQIYVAKNKPAAPAAPAAKATAPAASAAPASKTSTSAASTPTASKVVAKDKASASQAASAGTVTEKPAAKPAAKPASKSSVKPASAKKAPVKPAGSVPRTPKPPKNAAPKKP